ncbi:hypothetical protein CWI37_1093p0010 [Hamiltosporidium tvaerminnensis]|uniref:Mitochondrial import receptor subunit TOM70 n=1 Tax=Hamiltosporidium tvaerminnensis TaxID=1176355 RepID=A0A4Q9KYT5_9MICR|nr:hypothetical protein CWI37_1093p0010 [Hamiltosporidium tvaerminnensis]
MSKKSIGAIITAGIALVGTSFIFYNKIKQRRKQRNIERSSGLKQEGNILFKHNKIEEALQLYLEAESLLEEDNIERVFIYNNISTCYFLLQDYKNSLIFSSKTLRIDNKNLKALRIYMETNIKLNNTDEALFYSFVLSVVSKYRNDKNSDKSKSIANSLLNEKTRIETIEYLKIKRDFLPFTVLNDFFSKIKNLENFVSDEKDNLIMKLLDSKEYKELIVFEGNTELIMFVKGGIEFCRGNIEQAKEYFSQNNFLYSVIMLEYINSEDPEYKYSNILDEIISNECNDVFILCYAALIFTKIKDFGKSNEMLEKAELIDSNYHFIFLVKIYNLMSNESTGEMVYKLLEKCRNEFFDKVDLMSVVCDVYLQFSDYNSAIELVKEMIKGFSDDPRPYIYMGLLHEVSSKNELAMQNYLKAIEVDSTFCKSYILYAKSLLMVYDKKCRSWFENALNIATSFEEIYEIKQNLLLMQIEERISALYPELNSE